MRRKRKRRLKKVAKRSIPSGKCKPVAQVSSSSNDAKPCRIVVLISGNGSNLQAIIDRCANGSIRAEVVAVIRNVGSAFGLALHWHRCGPAVPSGHHKHPPQDALQTVSERLPGSVPEPCTDTVAASSDQSRRRACTVISTLAPPKSRGDSVVVRAGNASPSKNGR